MISNAGYRRSTTARKIYTEDENVLLVYDYEHRRKYDMFSVYLDEDKNVQYAEFTKVTQDKETRKLTSQVFCINNINDLNKYIG
jgi:hypothetical protein